MSAQKIPDLAFGDVTSTSTAGNTVCTVRESGRVYCNKSDHRGAPHIGESFSLERSTAIPPLGGTILVGAPLIAVGVALGGANVCPGAGTLSLPLTLPGNPLFIGAPPYFQVLPLDAGATGGVSMSNAVELWIA